MANIYCYQYGEPLLLLGVVDDYISFNFNRSYSGIGEWQLVLDGNTLNAQRVKGMSIISLSDGVAGYMKHYADVIEDGKHTITYTGVELKGITAKRIIIPPSGSAYQAYANKSPEYIIADLIQTQVINPADTSRKIAGSLSTIMEGVTRIAYNGRYAVLSDEIEALATAYNLGWCASVKNGAIVWDIWHGIDRTASQTTNDRMMLDYEYGTMNNSSIELEDSVPNFMIVAGQGEGADRALSILNQNESGLNRIETFLDARDVADSALLTQRGEEKLAEFGDSSVYNATLSQQFTAQYRTSFELGDIGTVRDTKLPDGEMDYRLTSIEEVYENNTLTLNVVFGYDKSELKDAIKRMNSKRDSLLATESVTGLTEIDLSSTSVVGTAAVVNGGTGADTPEEALANLGAAAAEHTHAITEVTNLQTSLDTLSSSLAGKAASSHTHAQSEITGLSTSLAQKFDASKIIYATTAPTGVLGALWLKPQ